MLHIKFLFSYKKSLKHTETRVILSSFLESTKLVRFNYLVNRFNNLKFFFFSNFYEQAEQRIITNCILKDMTHLLKMWRQIRGYPQNGNTTHTNANTSKKNKILFNFRVSQFYKMFGQKKRNIYPTLVKAEYTNRLWHYNWFLEWLQAHLFSRRMAILGNRAGNFNPVLLAGHQTNGYKRFGKAAKIGKAKKLTKVYTVGVPFLFAKYIYLSNTPYGFPKIILRDEVNKRLGKKFHRRELKK